MNRIKIVLLILIMSGFPIGISAQISVDDSQNANQLASILTGTSSCIIPINPIVSGYTSSNKSYGVFNKKTGSNFPFESGIILSTRQSIISEDKTIIGEVWNDEDIDLKQALGINYLTHNRTYLEFEFEAKTEVLSFKYLFASDEYRKNLTYIPCNNSQLSDGVAILIKEANNPTSKYENLAVILNDKKEKISVSSFNIRPDFFMSGIKKCDKKNEEYFDSALYNSASPNPINFAGQTKVLEAKKDNLIPGKKYKIKFVIAEGPSPSEFSALFVEAGSFTSKIDLGPDLTNKNALCFGETHELNSGLTGTNHIWTKTDSGSTLTLPETGNSLLVEQKGDYKLKVIDTGCTFTGEIKIAYFDKITVTNQTYPLCESILTPNQAIFDLDSKKSAIIGTSNLKINNYLDSYGNPIDPSNYIGTNGEIIEIEVEDPNTGCVEKAELTLQTIPTSTDTITPPEPLIKDFSGNKNGITLMPLNTTDPFEFSLDGFNFQKAPLFYKRESFNDTFYILNTTSCKVAEGKYTILNHPTFFTPNEDIANDYWKINKLFDVDPDAKVIIFDRYGKYIKQFDSNTITNQGWDGKYNGAFLPADDYWFSVQFSNREAKGHFSLIR
mgnify:CR=1 FL=1